MPYTWSLEVNMHGAKLEEFS